MPRPNDETGFIRKFEQTIVGFDNRLRTLEAGQSTLQEGMRNLKADRCDAHAESIKELYASRNALETSVELLKRSDTGVTAVCRELDKTVAELDRKALLLGTGEQSVSNKLDAIDGWNVPTRLQQLETGVAGLKSAGAEEKKERKDYKLLIYGAIIGLGSSVLSGVITWLITS